MNSSAGPAPVTSSNPLALVLQPIHGTLLCSALLSVAGAALSLLPLAAIARIAAKALSSEVSFIAQIEGVIVSSIGCLLLGMTLLVAAEMLAHRADARLTHQLRLRTAQHLARLPLGWFTQRGSGEVKQVLQDDIATLHGLTAHFYPGCGRAAGTILAAAGYLLAVDWRMALIALLPFPGFIWFLRRALKASSANLPAFATRMAQLNHATVEFVSGIPVLKAFAGGDRAHAGYHRAVDDFAEAFAQFTRPLVQQMAHAHALVAPLTVLGVVLGCGTLFVTQGWMPASDLLPFVLLTPAICAPLLLLHTLLHDLDSGKAAAQRVLQLLQTPVLSTPAAAEQRVPHNNELRFCNVSYAYAEREPVVAELNFSLAPGSMTAIVGASGAGKSTIAQLLLRFFDPSAGRIELGGVDLRQIASAELYRRIGFVLQDVRLVHASVRDNIALGRANASQQQIEQAARAANLHERIMALPGNYAAVIGEDALLSGGEAQRLSIARAMLLDPPILVLDEPTAAADAGNEAAIQDALSQLAPGRTLLVIAHRLQTVMHADRILVVEDGRIVEQGRHAELLAGNGRYAKLWRYNQSGSTLQVEAASC